MSDLSVVTEPAPNAEMFAIAMDMRECSVARLSELTGISRRTLYQYRYGEKNIPPDHLEKFADLLDFPTSFFFQTGNYHTPFYRRLNYDPPLRQQAYQLLKRVEDEDLIEVLAMLNDVIATAEANKAASFREGMLP